MFIARTDKEFRLSHAVQLQMFVYLTTKWAGKVLKLKQEKSSSLFSFVLKERTITECNGSHAYLQVLSLALSLLCYKCLLAMANPSAKDWYTYEARLNSVGWEEPAGNLPRKHPL